MPASPSIALLLVNLGTPDAPTARAVRRYLGEFLHDHRVVQLTRWLWCPLLHFAILPLRGPKVAHKYAQIWMEEGSPLAVHTRRLAAVVQSLQPQWRVVHAMRYGQPAIATVLERLRAEGVRQVVVLPLYPQYSTTTTASVADAVAKAGVGLDVRMIDDYAVDPAWVDAVADSIRMDRAAHGTGRHLLFSFHGLPQRLADQGDPYPQRCEASAEAIAAALDLPADAWSLSYQSRFGRERWLQPAAAEVLDELAARGVDSVDVVCPGFAVDCLETLEEVAMMLAARFAERGGRLHYIPCLNEAPSHAQALAALAQRRLDMCDA
ncbi:ferrochelatase [Luteimonas cucumeris]|uniref:Ferrochelatase n=1 Tax=Luteimonas cucumeris TaxID=985012 RepID=A0A562KVL5_9GAMM|nr:ferrochelatase [Luteimonas cucumeris]TWH99376.1 ferrochelatase [Luteimonas cucumeris]